ncbi:MAG: hypothetical protein V4579_07475 [Pseudomonadota bacterium]
MNYTATFGTARHPFRATLPLRTLRRLPNAEPEVQARMAAGGGNSAGASTDRPPARARRFVTKQEVKDFLLAYCACFIAVSAYLG